MSKLEENKEEDYKKIVKQLVTKIIKYDNICSHYKIVIDGIPCNLSLDKNKNQTKLLLSIDTNIIIKEDDIDEDDSSILFKKNLSLFKNNYDIPKNLDGMLDELEILMNYKFFKDDLITVDKFDLDKAFNLYLYKLQNKDPPKCYICLNYSNEYKTPCDHDVCIQCLSQSTAKGNKQCGICRENLYYEYGE